MSAVVFEQDSSRGRKIACGEMVPLFSDAVSNQEDAVRPEGPEHPQLKALEFPEIVVQLLKLLSVDNGADIG